MRRDTSLRYVFLAHVRLCTLPSKSLARLVLLASLRCFFFNQVYIFNSKNSKWVYHVCVELIFRAVNDATAKAVDTIVQHGVLTFGDGALLVYEINV